MAKPGGAGVPPIGTVGVSDNGNDRGVFTRLDFRSNNGQSIIGPTNESTQTATITVNTGQAVFTQSNVFINPVTGNDTKDGTTPAKAIKTWAEFQRRIGIWGIVKGVVTVTLLGDLPPSDPITLLAIMQGGRVVVQGQRTIVASGTITAKVDQNNATNTPWSITDASKPAAFWSNLVGDTVVIPAQGARTLEAWASVLKDLGAQTGRTGEWAEQADTTEPAMGPQVGETYKVVTFTQATLGPISIGIYSEPALVTVTPFAVEGFVFQDVNIVQTPNQFTISATDTLGSSDEAGVIFLRCRIDQPMEVPASNLNAVFAGTTFTSTLGVFGQCFLLWGTSFVSVPGFTFGGSACSSLGGGLIVADGVTSQGFTPGGASGLDVRGTALVAQWGFLDVQHGFVTNGGGGFGDLHLGADGSIYGGFGMPWGTTRFSPFSFPQSAISIIDASGTLSIVPTLDSTFQPGVAVTFDDSSTGDQAVSFNITASNYTQNFTCAWAALLVAPPMGGMYESVPGFKAAAMLSPRTGTVINYEAF